MTRGIAWLEHLVGGAQERVFFDFNMGSEGIFQIAQVRDNDYFGKIVLDSFDDFDQALQSLVILSAEAFIDHQGTQTRARAPSQHFGERNTQGEINAKGFTARKEFVISRSKRITDLDIEGFGHISSASIALGFERQVHSIITHPGQDAIGLVGQFRYGIFDDDGLQAVFAKHLHQIPV